MNMKQWQFNLLLVGVSLVIILAVASAVMGFNPVTFALNSLVYLLVVVGGLILLPGAIGGAASWAIGLWDSRNDDENHLSGWHILPALALSSVLALTWAKWIVPLVSGLPQLNTWAWEFIRFRTVYETMPIGWLVAVFFLALCGYGIGRLIES